MIPNPNLCPAHIRESLDAYANEGRPTGDFLRAVLSNNLRESFGRADHVNLTFMPHIVAYVYERVPSLAWGSEALVDAWLRRKKAEREKVATEATS